MHIFHLVAFHKGNIYRLWVGIFLILAGVILFIDRYLRTGWITYTIMPSMGLLLFYLGVRQRKFLSVIFGCLFVGIGIGVWAYLSQISQESSIANQLGNFIFLFGLSWLTIALSTLLMRKPYWWALVPAGIMIGSGYSISNYELSLFYLILYLGLGLGLALIVWGLAARLLGLVIPGCLLITVSPGIFLAWGSSTINNSLVQTGIMLVWFSFGWALITACGKIITRRSLWWPLIPGGILLTIGYGLYIGGDPDSAGNFISNTGSIGLVILGLYLILMRKGIHH